MAKTKLYTFYMSPYGAPTKHASWHINSTAVTVGVSFLVSQTNYCVPEASREVVLSLQTTLPRADTESDRCCGRKWAGDLGPLHVKPLEHNNWFESREKTRPL